MAYLLHNGDTILSKFRGLHIAIFNAKTGLSIELVREGYMLANGV